jgi:hypothetical protein
MHEHQQAAQTHQLSYLGHVNLAHLMMDQLSHLQDEVLIVLLVLYALFEALEVEFRCLVVNRQSPHLGNQ